MYRGKEKKHSEIKSIFFLTQELLSDKYYKSRAVGVTSEGGLDIDRHPFRAISLLLFLFPYSSAVLEKRVFYTLYFRDTGSHVVRATIKHNEYCLFKYLETEFTALM